MTILNAVLARGYALVLADTEATVPTAGGAARAGVTKLFALPHARAVLSGRGSLVFLASSFAGLVASGAETVDAMAEALPALLPAMHAATAAQLAGGGIEVSGFERQALLLVGWSPERKRMVGWSYVQADAAAGFVAEEVDEFYFGPWEAELGPAPEPRTLPAMVDTAERQRAWLRRHHPDAAAGGELIAAHIDRDGIALRAVHKFA